MNQEEIRDYCMAKRGAEESFPFNETTLVFKVGGKMFLLLALDENPPAFNVKSSPDKAIELREKYSGITSGFHMSKTHWNTVSGDGTVPKKVMLQCIDDSYELVVSGLPKKVKEELAKKK